MASKSRRTTHVDYFHGPDETPSIGSLGIDDSSSLAGAVSSLTPDDLHSLATSLGGTDARGVDDLSSTGCGFLSNLY